MSTAFKFFLGICFVAVFAAGGVFGTRALMSQDGGGSGRSEAPATRVGLATPEMREIEDDVTGVGTLAAIRSVMLVPSAAGRVTEVPVVSGQEVEAGEILIQLDDRAAQAALSEAEATLAEAENDFRRFEELEDSDTVAEARLEQARATYRRAEAAVMSARATLDDRALTAPFAGTLGLIDIEPGSYLAAGTEIAPLVDLSAVRVDLSLPERYFDRVAPGQPVTVTVPAYPDQRFEGEVSVRAPQIDLETRSFDLRARIDNPEGRLVGGMFANARLVLDTYSGLAITDDAIISEGLTSYVFTVSDGTAARTGITPGQSVGALTEVVDGLEAEDRVVVAGWDNLTDGAPVEIDEEIEGGALQ